MLTNCNFKRKEKYYIPGPNNPPTEKPVFTEYLICQLKKLGFQGNTPTNICDGEENCVLWKNDPFVGNKIRLNRIKNGEIFDESGYCLQCGWNFRAQNGCPLCNPHKQAKREKGDKQNTTETNK